MFNQHEMRIWCRMRKMHCRCLCIGFVHLIHKFNHVIYVLFMKFGVWIWLLQILLIWLIDCVHRQQFEALYKEIPNPFSIHSTSKILSRWNHFIPIYIYSSSWMQSMLLFFLSKDGTKDGIVVPIQWKWRAHKKSCKRKYSIFIYIEMP